MYEITPPCDPEGGGGMVRGLGRRSHWIGVRLCKILPESEKLYFSPSASYSNRCDIQQFGQLVCTASGNLQRGAVSTEPKAMAWVDVHLVTTAGTHNTGFRHKSHIGGPCVGTTGSRLQMCRVAQPMDGKSVFAANLPDIGCCRRVYIP